MPSLFELRGLIYYCSLFVATTRAMIVVLFGLVEKRRHHPHDVSPGRFINTVPAKQFSPNIQSYDNLDKLPRKKSHAKSSLYRLGLFVFLTIAWYAPAADTAHQLMTQASCLHGGITRC